MLMERYLKSLMLRYSSAMLYSMWYMRMHDDSAMNMKHAMNGMILSIFLSDNNTNRRLKAIAVTEYIMDIQTQLLAFSDILELKVFILLWF